MRILKSLGLILLASPLLAEQLKTVFNPHTGSPDFITALSTTSIQAGSGVTISTTTSGVIVSSTGGGGSIATCGSSPLGIQFADSANCTWCTTIATTGNLITTFLSCPVAPVFRTCSKGQTLGLLAAITCAGTLR